MGGVVAHKSLTGSGHTQVCKATKFKVHRLWVRQAPHIIKDIREKPLVPTAGRTVGTTLVPTEGRTVVTTLVPAEGRTMGTTLVPTEGPAMGRDSTVPTEGRTVGTTLMPTEGRTVRENAGAHGRTHSGEDTGAHGRTHSGRRHWCPQKDAQWGHWCPRKDAQWEATLVPTEGRTAG